MSLMKEGPAGALVSGMDISEVRCQEIEEFKVVR